jgi:hypothetical protein
MLYVPRRNTRKETQYNQKLLNHLYCSQFKSRDFRTVTEVIALANSISILNEVSFFYFPEATCEFICTQALMISPFLK